MLSIQGILDQLELGTIGGGSLYWLACEMGAVPPPARSSFVHRSLKVQV